MAKSGQYESKQEIKMVKDTDPRRIRLLLPTVTQTAFLFALNCACTTTLLIPYRRNQSVYL